MTPEESPSLKETADVFSDALLSVEKQKIDRYAQSAFQHCITVTLPTVIYRLAAFKVVVEKLKKVHFCLR